MATTQRDNYQFTPSNPSAFEPPRYRFDPMPEFFGLPDLLAPDRPTPLGEYTPSQEEVGAWLSRLANDPNITDDEFLSYETQVQQNPRSLPSLRQETYTLSRDREADALAKQERARAEEYRTGALQDLSKLERTYRPQFQQEINRFTGGGADLSKDFIHRDPTYANAISATDRAINAATQRARDNAALNMSASGGGVSGKQLSNLSSMELAGANEQGRVRAGAFQDARGQLTSARDQLRGFDTMAMQARGDINSGYQPRFMDIANFQTARPYSDFSTAYGTAVDSSLAGHGVRQADAGLGLQFLSIPAGMASDFNRQAMSMLPGRR